MSSTLTICQGLQSCLEPLVIDSRVLLHQLDPSKQVSSIPWPKKQTEIPNPENPKNSPIEKICENNKNGQEEKPTWSLLQSLTKTSYNFKNLTDDQEKEVYIHPLVKRSTSTLSSRSLAMCTESLGSETGDGIDSYDGDFSYNVIEKQSSIPIEIPKTREIRKKVKYISSSFPPPLTSISGNDGVQVKTHREGGRLVIKAFSYSSSNTCFRTERENGRLRISLNRDGYIVDEEEVEENVDEFDEVLGQNDDDKKVNEHFWGESVNEDVKIGCKKGGKEWSSSRCNEDRIKRIPSLPFCVAIS